MIDAHNHLHDARLVPHRATIFAELAQLGVTRAVVNGTREDDWPSVAALGREHSFVIPSFGIHPWHVAARSPDWLIFQATQIWFAPVFQVARQIAAKG